MAGSGAGSNLVQGFLLTNVSSTSSSVANPLTTYGTFGVNDSGGALAEARGFTKWTFSLINIGTVALAGYTVTLYGTVDPNANQTWWYACQGRTPSGTSALPAGGVPNALGSAAQGYYPGIPTSSWFVLPGPSEAGTGGGIANPLTPTTPIFTVNLPLNMVRAVVTANSAATGTFNVAAQAIP
jgi:hypothetical protein